MKRKFLVVGGLAIYKWNLFDSGQIVADYFSPNAKKFSVQRTAFSVQRTGNSVQQIAIWFVDRCLWDLGAGPQDS